MDNNPSVLIITPFFRPNVGGVETRFDEITKALSKRDIDVNVLTFQPLTTKNAHGKSYEESENIRIWRYPWLGGDLFHKLLEYPVLELIYLALPLFLYSFFFLLRKKGRLKITVVHTAGLNATFVGVLLKPIFRFRLVASTHALYTFETRTLFSKVISFVLNRTDCVLAIAEKSKEELSRIGVDPRKIIVQPTWVNQDVFRPMDKRVCKSKLGLESAFVFGFVGRLKSIKGIPLILKFAEEIKERKNVKFVFIGVGELKDALEKKSRELPNVLFFGQVENYQIPEYINSFDVFLAPAQYPEGFSRVVVEALSCGVPVLATNAGCLPEIVNGDVGWLVDQGYEPLKRFLVSILEDEKKDLSIRAEKCYKYSREEFSEKTVQRLIDAYFILGDVKSL